MSTDGDTDWHRSIVLDHTGRFNVALHPDFQEGAFRTHMLESQGIPCDPYHSAVPGQSTEPEIHVGPPRALNRAARLSVEAARMPPRLLEGHSAAG
ncbi:MAG: hypothetical protein OXN89_18025 [Bryobacterales bacterium]|nr:hypothetical protein [Bryobacterales bacterium]